MGEFLIGVILSDIIKKLNLNVWEELLLFGIY